MSTNAPFELFCNYNTLNRLRVESRALRVAVGWSHYPIAADRSPLEERYKEVRHLLGSVDVQNCSLDVTWTPHDTYENNPGAFECSPAYVRMIYELVGGEGFASADMKQMAGEAWRYRGWLVTKLDVALLRTYFIDGRRGSHPLRGRRTACTNDTDREDQTAGEADHGKSEEAFGKAS